MENSFSNPNQSGKHRIGLSFLLAVALGSCAATKVRAQVVVAPNVLATNGGNTPIVAFSQPGVVMRFMLIYDASQFGSLSGPSLLTQFAFRPDALAGSSGSNLSSLRLYVSTTGRSVAGMSTTFSQNIGSNNTLVFDGTLTQATKSLPGPGNTRQFDIVTPFTTPFLYDPADGNLVLDLQISNGNGPGIRFDGITGNPAIRALGNFNSATAATGGFAVPQVTQFTFAPAPLATIRTSQVEVCWNSISNLTYQVQYRSDLTTNLWTSLVDCIRSTNSTSSVYDAVVAGQPKRFYRVLPANCVP